MGHEDYMREAISLAKQAAEDGDVPVGCVIVREGVVIGRGRNRREERGDATAHAEIEAIRDACRRIGSWRLHGCTMYVTLEPCPMCAGGIINARIDTIRYGARDAKAGCCTSVLNLFEESFNHRPRIYQGPLVEECEGILQTFFQNLRDKNQEDEKI
ncbi:MAG: nucleoside deaminase [Lawsonibacter sp.]|jgi:tRNA(adenine34) deaminase